MEEVQYCWVPSSGDVVVGRCDVILQCDVVRGLDIGLGFREQWRSCRRGFLEAHPVGEVGNFVSSTAKWVSVYSTGPKGC